jgi:hypothetical protein
MKRVCVVCEGQTEETFVREVLAPAFYPRGLNLVPEMVQTSPGHKGGALTYERLKRHLRNTLRQKSAPVVTTLIDLYRLDSDFPGFAHSRMQAGLARRLGVLREALHADVVAEAGCQPGRFIPYIQPHEFEALLFSDVPTLTRVESGWQAAHLGPYAPRASRRSTSTTDRNPSPPRIWPASCAIPASTSRGTGRLLLGGSVWRASSPSAPSSRRGWRSCEPWRPRGDRTRLLAGSLCGPELRRCSTSGFRSPASPRT